MKKKILFMIILGCFFTVPLAAQAVCKFPNGKTWKNQHNSEMTVNVNTSNELSGTYTTAKGCGVGIPRPLTGFCNGYAVTFSVNWQECVSTTSWSGTYLNGKLQTLWHLVLAKKPEWDSVITGSDSFTEK